MRSKTPLALMEQVVMVLVFALAASLCLRVFVFSNQVSRQNSDVDHAVLLAQNTAETIKTYGGVENAADAAGGTILRMPWVVYYDKDLNPVQSQTDACYEVHSLPEISGVEGLGKATIEVFRSDGNQSLFSLTVNWQEVTANG